jgi:BTB/POZ domain
VVTRLLTSHIADIYVGPESTHWPIHERLLCYHSPFFTSLFDSDDKDPAKKKDGNHSYRLPDEDDYSFELLVGWLYAKAIRQPRSETDIGPLLDLYLLSEKFEMKKLSNDVVEVVREWYFLTGTYPGLRRVQYIYAETDEDNEMREMMVSSIARQLTTSDMIPVHWANALQRNGQLAVDIIRSIQQWHLEAKSIPDMRDGSEKRGRLENGGAFSAIEPEAAGSVETADTGDTNLGIESLNSDTEKTQHKSDDE